MEAKPHSFKRNLLAAGVSSCLLASAGAVAQGARPLTAATDPAAEEVLVLGVRAAQESAINTKRDAVTVVDAISAEDIGKLPDVTITDSLQRISGIQIRRSAGEGGAVNIRGLPQVVTQLNGEQYLGANSVVSVQPNFGDIPSQLFKGAEVYKNATADLGNTGITGTVNLLTYRPLDFDEGFNAAGSAELQYGDETGETDPSLSGLAAWHNDRVGVLVAATYANLNLSNSYNGFNTGNPGEVGWTGQTTFDGRSYLGAQGFAAWNQVTERERIGLNSSLQVDLGEGFILTADFFYTDQEEYNRKVGMSFTNKWQGWDWFTPAVTSETGTDFGAWQVLELAGNRLKSFTQNDSFFAQSRNFNVQLDYDNGGPFTGTFRAIRGAASRDRRHGYNEGDLTNGSTTGINPFTWTTPAEGTDNYVPPDQRRPPGFFPAELCGPDALVLGVDGGCFQSVNPLGYSERPVLTLDTRGAHPTWSGFDRPLAGGLGEGATIGDYMTTLEAYNVGAFSSENNENSEGKLTVLRLDGSYAFEDGGVVTAVDLGVRSGQRSAEFERYNLFSPFYQAGCQAQWKATDVQLHEGDCQAGELVSGLLNGFELDDAFVGYTVLPNVPLDRYNHVKFITDFGPVRGIPGVWAVDPRDYDDPEAFHNRVFGSTTEYVIPGSTFRVELDELMFYGQVSFATGPVEGNLGVRVIETELKVTQNLAGNARPYGNTNVDEGDIFTSREYTDVLPSLNLTYHLADDLIARFAYSKAVTPLDLNRYGDGLVINTTLDSDPNSPTSGEFIASSASLNGDPSLDPWRSQNLDLSLEYYLAPASLVNVALFYVDVDSFVKTPTENRPVPDADGVVRREVSFTFPTQGEGGKLKGIELGGKFALADFIDSDSFLAALGADVNYTYSPGEQSVESEEDRNIFGEARPFPDNSEHQFNLVAWYESGPFQARIAYNYRSERLAMQGGAWGALDLYQASAAYVDLSASYDVTDAVTVYFNGSNITGEYEDYYLEFKDQFAFQNYYEPRYTVGVRARF